MRNPKEEKPEIDLTVPILPDAKPDDPCFGKLWDPSDNNCAVCHAIEICGILYQDSIKKKKEKFEKEEGPTLDMATFDSVPFDKIAKSAIKFYAKGEPVTLEELKENIAELARIKDPESIMEYIRRMLPKFSLTIDQGEIIPYEKGTDNYQTKGSLTR